MQNSSMTLAEFINQVASIEVPNYHRCYFGSIDIWNNIFEQLLGSADNFSCQSLGVITLQKKDKNGNFILIDGHQRIISLFLFISALNDEYNEAIRNIELKINNNDCSYIENIIENDLSSINGCNSKIIEAYNFFKSKLLGKGLDIETILANLKRIRVVNVILEESISDIENIYCSLNQTFTQVDLIRNFIYNQLKSVDLFHIFNTYWLTTEKNLDSNINKFLVDYLTIQNNGLIPKQNNLYKDFVEFFNKLTKYRTKDEAVKHIYRYANYYTRIINSDIKDADLKVKLNEINSCKAYDTYPYLMEVFEDYEYAHINKHILLEILDMVILFVNKRESKSNDAIGVNFASLSKDINKMLALREHTPRIVTQEFDDNSNNNKMTINQLIQKM